VSKQRKKLQELQNQYIKTTQFNQSTVYAQMGALGVRPEHMLLFASTMNKIDDSSTILSK
jgi:hypothetical protein